MSFIALIKSNKLVGEYLAAIWSLPPELAMQRLKTMYGIAGIKILSNIPSLMARMYAFKSMDAIVRSLMIATDRDAAMRSIISSQLPHLLMLMSIYTVSNVGYDILCNYLSRPLLSKLDDHIDSMLNPDDIAKMEGLPSDVGAQMKKYTMSNVMVHAEVNGSIVAWFISVSSSAMSGSIPLYVTVATIGVHCVVFYASYRVNGALSEKETELAALETRINVVQADLRRDYNHLHLILRNKDNVISSHIAELKKQQDAVRADIVHYQGLKAVSAMLDNATSLLSALASLTYITVEGDGLVNALYSVTRLPLFQDLDLNKTENKLYGNDGKCFVDVAQARNKKINHGFAWDDNITRTFVGKDGEADDVAKVKLPKANRILLKGPNGAGKTTVLQAIAGRKFSRDSTLNVTLPSSLEYNPVAYVQQGGIDLLASITNDGNPSRISMLNILTATLSNDVVNTYKQEILQSCTTLISDLSLNIKSVDETKLEDPCVLGAPSGGEWQKIKFIMMYLQVQYGNANLVVVDELFNHVDTATADMMEKKIVELSNSQPKVQWIFTDHRGAPNIGDKYLYQASMELAAPTAPAAAPGVSK